MSDRVQTKISRSADIYLPILKPEKNDEDLVLMRNIFDEALVLMDRMALSNPFLLKKKRKYKLEPVCSF